MSSWAERKLIHCSTSRTYNEGSIQLPKSTIYRKALLFTKKHEENTCKEGSVCSVDYFLCALDNKDVYMRQEYIYDPKT